MSRICKKRGCDEKVHEDYKHCIFHCEKSEFNVSDVANFWRLFRVNYIVANVYDLVEEVEVSNVIFPSFNKHTIAFRNGLNKKCTFTNCTFQDDFNLSNVRNKDKIIFDNCTFFGDIQLYTSSAMEIINSEFKKELSLGNSNWKKLDVKNTKFIKDVIITTIETLRISQKAIFRGNLNVHGTGNLKFDFDNSVCSKKFLVQSTDEINIDNIKVISATIFNFVNLVINIKNNIFTSDVLFDKSDTLNLHKVVFSKGLALNSDKYNKIFFDNVELDDITVGSGHSLELINTKIKGSFIQEEQFDEIKIKETKCSENFELFDVKKFDVKNLVVNGFTNLNGKYTEINLEQKSFFKNVSINSTNTLAINDIHIDGDLDLLGEEYKSVLIQNTNISNELKINKVADLQLKEIKSKPIVKLIHTKYDKVLIRDVRFHDLEINAIDNLDIKDSIIWGELKFLSKDNENIKLSNVKLKNKCDFPETKQLDIYEKCNFDKLVSFEKISILRLNDSIFNNEIYFNCEYEEVSLERCEYKGLVHAQKHCEFGNLSIVESKFFNDMKMSGVEVKMLRITGCEFKQNVVLTNTKIEKISIGHKDTESESYNNSVFWSVVDFSMSSLKDIKIINTTFLDELNFNNMEGNLDLTSCNEMTVNTLNINNTSILNLFRYSDGIRLENFNIDKSVIDTVSDEIDINKVNIDNIKWNNLEIRKNINMTLVEIKKFTIGNLNMEHRFKIKHSPIEAISFIACTFEDLQIIDNAKETFDSKLKFKNTTIKNAVLDKLNYESFTMSDAHVSEAKIGYVKFKKGSRETNRFFKNYYDSISDYIQANEYYKQEMQEQYNVTANKNEKFILGIGKVVSDFGQSWDRPLLWIIGLTLLAFAAIHLDKFSIEFLLNNKIKILNGLAEFSNPFSKSAADKYQSVYIIWMIHKIAMTVFIYHFVVAIKRKTRR